MSWPIALPSFFQYRYRLPSAARNGLASIEPPSSGWQISGLLLRSTYGPAGFDATATLTHCRPDASSAVV